MLQSADFVGPCYADTPPVFILLMTYLPRLLCVPILKKLLKEKVNINSFIFTVNYFPINLLDDQ